MNLKVNQKLISLIENSFENEFSIDCHQNTKNASRFSMFRPHINKGFLSLLKNYFFSFLFVIFFPVFPFLNSKLCRIRVVGGGNKFLITFSDKANVIYSDLVSANSDLSYIQVGVSNVGRKVAFPFDEYFTYLYSVFAIIKRYKKDIWFLKSIILIPEMLTLYAYLSRNSVDKIYMTNQFDRWAYLLSFFSNENDCYLELRQHGITDSGFLPSIKMPLVNKLVVYDEKELKYFKLRVVEKIIEVAFKPPTLNLSDVDGCNFNILIAASGSYEHSDYEITLIKLLAKKVRGKVFYKPHPLLTNKSALELLITYGFHYISDKDFFPDVDVMIHFSSTLAAEYRNSSTDVKIFNIENHLCIDIALKEIMNIYTD